MTNSARSRSNILEYLPEIYQSKPFLGQFLLAFEKILLDREDGVNYSHQGLEAKIAHIHTYFDPQQTPEEFLPWLASWTALSLRADLAPQQQRDFIANIVERYRFRGTKANLQALLELFIKGTPTITETTIPETIDAEFQIGDSQLLNQNPQQLPPQSILGKGTYIGGSSPHFFKVKIALSKGLNPDQLSRQVEIASAIIEQEKPAHTDYQLEIIFPDTIQLADPTSGIKGSQIGIDTLLGNIPENLEST
ncbi:phage tail protein [Moorena producens]|uniref:phage tail protein n=1 Tax=Moorena producens TaxID=1155739 RepID=UPI003C76292F